MCARCCLFFFFYKQKPAYEMLMSDLSSDVCSSDLVGTVTTHGASGRFATTQSSPARTPASGPAKPSTESAATGNPYPAKRVGSPLAFSKIGRASWRERVCQYV